MNQQIFKKLYTVQEKKNQWSIYRTHSFSLPCSYTEMRLWHKTSIFFMHIIFFSSVIIFLLFFYRRDESTVVLWHTHTYLFLVYILFFHSFSYHKSGITLSNILFFLLTLFRKERKKNKGKHFLSTEFSSFFICISYR